MKEEIVDPFFVVLNNGTALVKRAYPTAIFLEADSPWQVSGTLYDWRLVYSIPASPGKGPQTVFLYSKDFQFSSPQLVHDVFLESDPIPLPIAMGILQASAIKSEAGYPGTASATTVRWPVYPRTPEPEYMFMMPSAGLFVNVGINTGKVTTTPIPPS